MTKIMTGRMFKIVRFCFIVFSLSFFLNGCGDGSSGPSTVNITGTTWFGDHTANGTDKIDFSFTAMQTGENISGDMAWNGLNPPVYTTYTGTISGQDITMSWTQNGVTVTLTGTVSSDGTKMSGSWSSTDGTSGTYQATGSHFHT